MAMMRCAESQLLVIDVQAGLAPHVSDHARVIANCARLLGYARTLDVPATITEHYPQGLGATVDAVREAAAPTHETLAKIAFSCWRDAHLHKRIDTLRRKGRSQVIVAGMETHVCVQQTVLDLLASGLSVFVVADAVGSRFDEVRRIALDRMRDRSAQVVSHEMVAFEWLERGDAERFKDVMRLLK
jgi:nicotinamidase-related amidase